MRQLLAGLLCVACQSPEGGESGTTAPPATGAERKPPLVLQTAAPIPKHKARRLVSIPEGTDPLVILTANLFVANEVTFVDVTKALRTGADPVLEQIATATDRLESDMGKGIPAIVAGLDELEGAFRAYGERAPDDARAQSTWTLALFAISTLSYTLKLPNETAEKRRDEAGRLATMLSKKFVDDPNAQFAAGSVCEDSPREDRVDCMRAFKRCLELAPQAEQCAERLARMRSEYQRPACDARDLHSGLAFYEAEGDPPRRVGEAALTRADFVRAQDGMMNGGGNRPGGRAVAVALQISKEREKHLAEWTGRIAAAKGAIIVMDGDTVLMSPRLITSFHLTIAISGSTVAKICDKPFIPALPPDLVEEAGGQSVPP